MTVSQTEEESKGKEYSFHQLVADSAELHESVKVTFAGLSDVREAIFGHESLNLIH